MLSSADFHSDFKSWTVSTHEVGVIGLLFERYVPDETLTALLKEKDRGIFSWKAKGPSLVRFSLNQEGTQAFTLTLAGTLHLCSACTKCLNEIEHEIELKLHMRLLEQEVVHNEDKDDELVFDSDSLDDENDSVVGYFSKKSIDLGLILREQIFFSVPDYPYCGGPFAVEKEDCRVLLLTSSDDKPRESPFMKLLKKT